MKIVVLAGGTSTERDVSIVSGTGICGALRQKGHQAILVDVFCGQEEVDWEDPFPAEYDVEKAAAYIRGFNLQMAELKKTRKNFFGPNVIDLCKKADFVFLGLHGANGEDGKLQGAFDLMGIPYTGTGYLSSAMAMDKGVTKAMFQMRGVPTPAGKSGSRTEKTGCLIAPGFITWIFIQRHDLQIVIAIFDQIWNQNINHFFIVIPVICFVRRLAKRTKMNFVNVQRFFSAVAAALQPLAVFEFIF